MKGIDLRFTDCKSANFDGADLTNAILTDAEMPDLKNANTTRAILP